MRELAASLSLSLASRCVLLCVSLPSCKRPPYSVDWCAFPRAVWDRPHVAGRLQSPIASRGIGVMEGEQVKAGSTPGSSQAVPHPSTNRALCRLTSEVERDPVHSTRYGRQRQKFTRSFKFCCSRAANDPTLCGLVRFPQGSLGSSTCCWEYPISYCLSRSWGDGV